MVAQNQVLNGRYRLDQQQGTGGMAVVYKATDLALGRTIAVKVLRPSLTSDPTFLARFRQEARNVANLNHPNIVTVHDVGQEGATYYMVMEFIEGQDLKRMIRASAPFSVERALHISIQICAGAGFAHRAGLVHADVKPQNILITGNDIVKITDFGIAQMLTVIQPDVRQNVVWGSPQYFSPEQASGMPPTPASDVYSIGVVMFEMLTGRLPYSGADQQELALAHIREAVPHIRDFNPNVPANLDWVINKVMSKEPAARYRTAEQLGRILISYQKQLQESGQIGFSPGIAMGTPTTTAPGQSPQPVPINPVTTSPFGGTGTPPPGPAPTLSPPLTPQQSPGTSAAPAPRVSPTMPGQPAQQPLQPYTPPNISQPPVVPLRSGGTGSLGRASTGQTPAEPARPITGPLKPQPSAQTPYEYTPETFGSGSFSPNYQTGPVAPNRIDLVTIALGVIAFLLVVGLIILWLMVWGAYT